MIPYALEGLAASLAAQGPEKYDKAKIYMQQAIQRGQELGNTNEPSDANLQLGKNHVQREKLRYGSQPI